MPPAWQILAASALLLIVTVLVIRLAARYKYLPVGWFWYLGTLVPVIAWFWLATRLWLTAILMSL